MYDEALLGNLIRLFDDRDETVSGCVDRKLMGMGHQVTDRLREAAGTETDETRKALILERRASLNRQFRLKDLQALGRSRGTAGFSLYEAAFIISSLLDENLSRQDFQGKIVGCSSRISAETSPRLTALENMEIFNHIFFDVLGFKVPGTGCEEWEYALLPQVLSSRKGNPTAISILYFLIADEAGMPLLPLCVDGGFIPAYVENGRELFCLNITDRGRPFDEMTLHRHFGDRCRGMHLQSTAVIPELWLESLVPVCRRSGGAGLLPALEQALRIWKGER